MRTRNVFLMVGMVALAACGGSRKQQASMPVTVSDSDFGRLPATQMAPVDNARDDLSQSRDDFARAKLRQTDAAQAVDLAQADLSVAAAELQRAAARTKMAEESNDPAQLAQARHMTETAQLRENTAKARLDFAQKLQAARAAEVAAAEKRIAYGETRLEQAKLQALQQAQVPAAQKYDAAQLDGRVAAARNEFDEAQGKAQAALAEASNAEGHWRELNRQLQARAAEVPRG